MTVSLIYRRRLVGTRGLQESDPNGAWVSLKGTKKGALACVTRPKPVKEIGFPNLTLFESALHLLEAQLEGLQLSYGRLSAYPIQTLIQCVVESRKVRIVYSIRVLVWEKLECSKSDFWNVDNIFTVNTLGSIES